MALFGFGKEKDDNPTPQERDAAYQARYAGKPLLLVLDNYIMDCIGHLPPDKREAVAVVVKRVFGGGGDWRRNLRDKLRLEDSIDDVIRQAWTKFQKDHPGVGPFSFAAGFSDAHFVPLLEGTPSERGDRATDPAEQREAEERKNRSLAILRRHHVPFIAHLPTIETAGSAKFRSAGEVARRATVLALVAAYAEPGSFPPEELLALLERRGVSNDLTNEERAFISIAEPAERERAQFTWQYECVKVLLWALGRVEELDYPGRICDVPAIVGMIARSEPGSFISEARLRDSRALLDEADLIYRYDWACVNARVKGEAAPAGLDGGIVVERHRALNWLIGYGGQEWDEVSTDT